MSNDALAASSLRRATCAARASRYRYRACAHLRHPRRLSRPAGCRCRLPAPPSANLGRRRQHRRRRPSRPRRRLPIG